MNPIVLIKNLEKTENTSETNLYKNSIEDISHPGRKGEEFGVKHQKETVKGQRERSPLYQKLHERVTRIWGNRRGQPRPGAMERPRPGRTACVIAVYCFVR